MSESLFVTEIFKSIQGESTWAGLPCVFVRLSFCDLRCAYCDTAYAFEAGEKRTVADVLSVALSYGCPLVEVTGGEPLLQPLCLPLLTELCDAGCTVLLETNGARDISAVDGRVHRIMDMKCPDSGECHRNRPENIEHLNTRDEVKFVISSRRDYEWAKEMVLGHALAERVQAVLFSAAHIPGGTQSAGLSPASLVEWMLEDRLPVRFQLQMHKFVWPHDRRGV